MDEENGDISPKRVLLCLCAYTFFLQFTPSEPYLVPILTKAKHFDNQEITTKIFPVSVYATLLFTLLAAPACSRFTYRSVIMIGTLGRLATFSTLVFGTSLLAMQIMQVTYALGLASDLVCSAYLFLLVNEDMFQSLTSFMQAASTFSFLVAAELGQLLVYKGFPLISLVYISITMVGLASFVSIFLPTRTATSGFLSLRDTLELKHRSTMFGSICSWFQDVWEMIKATWNQRLLQVLSVWWALQLGGSYLIENYGTNLFEAVDSSSIYNGHVTAATQGASCLAALLAIPVSRSAAKSRGFLYILGSGITWLLCLTMASSKVLWIVYLAYILCIAVNKLLLCVLYVQCAQFLSHRHYIFLFSLNAVAALVVQGLLQTLMEILDVSVVSLFSFLACYFFIVAALFSVGDVLISLFQHSYEDGLSRQSSR